MMYIYIYMYSRYPSLAQSVECSIHALIDLDCQKHKTLKTQGPGSFQKDSQKIDGKRKLPGR